MYVGKNWLSTRAKYAGDETETGREILKSSAISRFYCHRSTQATSIPAHLALYRVTLDQLRVVGGHDGFTWAAVVV